jgi:TrmH family RNA methyltransferase
VVEGASLLGEALRAGVLVESVYLAPGGWGPVVEAAYRSGARVHDLAPGVLERVADTSTPQPVLAVVADVTVALEELAGSSLIVVCIDVRDPGNAGTVLRSAEAAGADGVVCCDGTVDVTNPKCVRASAGSLFHVPVVAGGDAVTVLEQIRGWGIRTLGATVGGGDQYTAVDLRAPTALVFGNEAHGLPDGSGAGLDGYVHIPMAGRGESLNVGMACAVLCFEAARQRRNTESGAQLRPSPESSGV